MSGLSKLGQCVGGWRGVNRLQDPHTGAPDDSAGSAVVTTLLEGRFVRMDYSWAYQGTDQEGSLLIGYQSDRARVTAHWIDSWHMSDGVMPCEGRVEPDGSVVVRGSYVAPPDQDWGWRIELKPADTSTLTLTMYNITPKGEEALAVEARYERA